MTGPNLKCLEPYFSDFIKLSTYYWSHSPIKKIKIRNRKVIVWRWPSHHIDVIKDLLTVAINYPDFIFSCLCQNITRYYCNTCDITKWTFDQLWNLQRSTERNTRLKRMIQLSLSIWFMQMTFYAQYRFLFCIASINKYPDWSIIFTAKLHCFNS